MSANAGRQEDPLIGSVFNGNFLLERVIGVGAMGRVYEAQQLSLGKKVAVKVLHRHLLGDEKLAMRFHREAKAASRLNHRNSIQIVDFGQGEDGSLYIAMELLAGDDLLTVIRRDFPMEPTRIASILAQVCDALDEAHHHGIIHRDLKPENIMLENTRSERDLVKVCDFGIAKVTDPHGDGEASEATLTMAGVVCGTPEYMSPEQARGEKLDARSDIYSLGVVLYHMLTGELPFKAESALGIVTKHLTEEPTPPSKRRADLNIHAALEAVCLRAMAKSRKDRPADTMEMRELLVGAVSGDDVSWLAPSLTPSGGLPVTSQKTGSGIVALEPHTSSTPTAVGELESVQAPRKRSNLAVIVAIAGLAVIGGAAGIYFVTNDLAGDERASRADEDDDDDRGKRSRDDDDDDSAGAGGLDDDDDDDGTTDHTAAPDTAEPETAAPVTAAATPAPETAKVKKIKKPKRPKTGDPAFTAVSTTAAPKTAAATAASARTAKDAYDDGMVLFGKGNCKAAIGRFREATGMDPGYAEAYREMGKCYTRLGKLAAAIPFYQKYLKLRPAAKDAAVYRTIVKTHEGK